MNIEQGMMNAEVDLRATMETNTDNRSTCRGVLVSFGFWGCLLLSGLGFAASTLSVRYAENHELTQQFAAGDAELRQLMQQVERYEQHCEALCRPAEDDFRMDEAARSMAIDPSLRFRLDEPVTTAEPDRNTATLPLWIDLLSRSPLARGMLLLASALLLAFAFGRLVDFDGPRSQWPKGEHSLRGPLARRLRRIGARYQFGAGQPSSRQRIRDDLGS